MVDAQMTSAVKLPDRVLLKIIETVSDPFLITALVVVFLMYLLLRQSQKTLDNSMKEVYTELRKMSQVLTQAVTANKVLTDIIIELKKKNGDKDN